MFAPSICLKAQCAPAQLTNPRHVRFSFTRRLVGEGRSPVFINAAQVRKAACKFRLVFHKIAAADSSPCRMSKQTPDLQKLHIHFSVEEDERTMTIAPSQSRNGFALEKRRGRASGRRRAAATREGGFTLFELLIVLSIMAIAMAALIPAVTSLSKSGGRRAARDSLLGGIEQARAEAIKSAQSTYIVFPTFTSGAQSTLDRYNYRSYAIFEDNAASPGNVKQLTDWKSFPTGVALRAVGTGALSSNSAPTANPPPPPPTPTFSFTPDTTATVQYQYLKFNSNGELQAPAATVLLAVFEGYVSNGNEVATGRKDASGNPYATEYLSVSQFTGRAEPVPSPTVAP
jgi:prepilin-type N-terminal cleavage/methylation domain-containing protein